MNYIKNQKFTNKYEILANNKLYLSMHFEKDKFKTLSINNYFTNLKLKNFIQSENSYNKDLEINIEKFKAKSRNYGQNNEKNKNEVEITFSNSYKLNENNSFLSSSNPKNNNNFQVIRPSSFVISKKKLSKNNIKFKKVNEEFLYKFDKSRKEKRNYSEIVDSKVTNMKSNDNSIQNSNRISTILKDQISSNKQFLNDIDNKANKTLRIPNHHNSLKLDEVSYESLTDDQITKFKNINIENLKNYSYVNDANKKERLSSFKMIKKCFNSDANNNTSDHNTSKNNTSSEDQINNNSNSRKNKAVIIIANPSTSKFELKKKNTDNLSTSITKIKNNEIINPKHSLNLALNSKMLNTIKSQFSSIADEQKLKNTPNKKPSTILSITPNKFNKNKNNKVKYKLSLVQNSNLLNLPAVVETNKMIDKNRGGSISIISNHINNNIVNMNFSNFSNVGNTYKKQNDSNTEKISEENLKVFMETINNKVDDMIKIKSGNTNLKPKVESPQNINHKLGNIKEDLNEDQVSLNRKSFEYNSLKNDANLNSTLTDKYIVNNLENITNFSLVTQGFFSESDYNNSNLTVNNISLDKNKNKNEFYTINNSHANQNDIKPKFNTIENCKKISKSQDYTNIPKNNLINPNMSNNKQISKNKFVLDGSYNTQNNIFNRSSLIKDDDITQFYSKMNSLKSENKDKEVKVIKKLSSKLKIVAEEEDTCNSIINKHLPNELEIKHLKSIDKIRNTDKQQRLSTFINNNYIDLAKFNSNSNTIIIDKKRKKTLKEVLNYNKHNIKKKKSVTQFEEIKPIERSTTINYILRKRELFDMRDKLLINRTRKFSEKLNK